MRSLVLVSPLEEGFVYFGGKSYSKSYYNSKRFCDLFCCGFLVL